MKKFSGLLLVLMLVGVAAQAQYSFSAGLIYDQALSEFRENINSSPVGVSAGGAYNFPNSRFSAGADLGVAMFANETYTASLEDQGHPGAFVEVDEEDCYLNYNAFLRYRLRDSGLVVPYGEVRAGGISFFNSKFYEEPYGANAPDEIENEFELEKFSYGLDSEPCSLIVLRV